jgi:single-stranded-DNA-specific exonuclease
MNQHLLSEQANELVRIGKKYRWFIPQSDYAAVVELASICKLSIPVAQVLYNRGFKTKASIEKFIFTIEEFSVHDPLLLKDGLKAVKRIEKAILNNEKILIAGDYDVDGITASALMLSCLVPLGAKANFFLPHRVKDGYGLSIKTIERASSSGYSLVVTVDNGITAFEPARRAKELGIDLIITDHHRPHEELPEAFAVIDPMQIDCSYPYKTLAGVGVIFKVMSLLYARRKLPLPVKAYELLLLGTVADVVPLTGENRYWVRECLKQINDSCSFSMHVLKNNGKVSRPYITSSDIGFSIAPQINALGRLEDARQGVMFLLGDVEEQTEQIGRVLLELNEARKLIEKTVLVDVENQIRSGAISLDAERIIMVASRDWPPGVIGLVASRIVASYGRPAILLHITPEGLAKGSCRSIPEFNMFDALEESRDLLLSFGGHSLAAGLSLHQDDLPLLKHRLEQRALNLLKEEDLQLKVKADASVNLSDISSNVCRDLAHLEPFGNSNSVPYFHIKSVTLIEPPRLMKDVHIKIKIFSDGAIKPVVFFNRPDLFPFFIQIQEKPFELLAQVSENYWNGGVSLELIGIDVAEIGDDNNN